MHQAIKPFYHAEIASARKARLQGQVDQAYHHLERAHILSQRYALPHTATHLRMLALAWRTGDPRELLGQLTRVVAALIFSRIWVPLGNTGRANVSPLKPMPIPEDLTHVLTRR